MKYPNQEIDPVEYLRNVLTTWKEFCKGHSRFVKAINDILAENERLKKELNDRR